LKLRSNTIWIQRLPFSRLAERVFAAVPSGGRKAKVIGILGNILDGDK